MSNLAILILSVSSILLLIRSRRISYALRMVNESRSRLRIENLELGHEVNRLSEPLIDHEAEASEEDLEP